MRRILVALDSSHRAPPVFERACELARAFDAQLIAYRAVLVPQQYPAAAASHADPLAPHLLRTAHEELMKLVAKHPEVSMRVVVRAAMSPDLGIIEASDELDVDLIVLGSHGYRGLDKLLGTTAGSVANRSRRDVFVVHHFEAPQDARRLV